VDAALDEEVTMPSKDRKERQLVVRMPRDLSDRLEAYAQKLRAEQPGPKWTMSDVIRKVLAEAMADVEPTKKTRK
jgi:hypothetical protein